ncbi:hypothetical protein GpartN1_g4483.t1 [Galdieria partita]|uniref:VASt domain-containing protein n=1 Tax=Galdieria partita TaxID=83374 RepID=A0A9C7PZE5_9RHOD|nr:hypothetical protein GpartN1_g4483.t1 [Galdieria partita]
MSEENVENHRMAIEVASSSQRTLNSSATLEQRTSAVSFSHTQNDTSFGKSATETQQDWSRMASEDTTVPATLKTREKSWNSIGNKNSAQSDSASTNLNKKTSKERNRLVSSNKPDKYSSIVTSSSGLNDSTYSASQISHSKTLHKRFHLPDSENLLGEFACALGKGVLMQGKLYMTNSYLCFFSGLFGRPLRVVIPLSDILSIRKKNVAMIFPTAIQIVLKDGRKYFFASFLTRNLAFQRLFLLWTLFKQGKLAELKSSAQFEKILENFGSQEDDNEDMHTVDDSVASNSEDSEMQGEENQERDEQQHNRIAETIRMFEREDFTQTSMFDNSFNDQDHLLVSCHLATSVLYLGELIALNSCPIGNETEEPNSVPSSSEEEGLDTTHSVLEEYHELRGDSNLEISKWQRHSTLGCIRTVKYYSPVHNKALAVGINKTRNEEHQRICLNPEKDYLLVEWTNQLLDIPFGDTFVMQTRIEAHDKSTNKNNKPECEVNIYLNVEWKKKVMWRRLIESNIHRETMESYETLTKVLKKYIENNRGNYVMDELVKNGNAKSTTRSKLEVQTDLPENSQKNKSSSSKTSLEDGFQSPNRKESWNARLRSLETQLYALFIFVLLISLIVLIGFFFVLRSERNQGHILSERIMQLEDLVQNQLATKHHKEWIPTVECNNEASVIKEQDLQRLDSLATQLNEVVSSLYSRQLLSKGKEES